MNNSICQTDHRTLIKQFENSYETHLNMVYFHFYKQLFISRLHCFCCIKIWEYFTSSCGHKAPIKPIALSKTLLVRFSHLISASIPSLKGQCALSHSRARLQRWTPFKVSSNEFHNKWERTNRLTRQKNK